MKDKQFHKLLICASSLHCERRRRHFCELNLSDGQLKVLANLLLMEGCIQKELAQRCRVRSATMTTLLQKMERDGLIFKKLIELFSRVTKNLDDLEKNMCD